LSERLARAVSYPLVMAGLFGLVLRIDWARRRGVPPADDRAALALAILPAAVLGFMWAVRAARSASRALLMWWAMRLEARREAQRTILLNLPVPVLAKIEENAAGIDELKQQMGFMKAALADVVRQDCEPAPALDDTAPLMGLVGTAITRSIKRDSA
jgi:hypothetical protein